MTNEANNKAARASHPGFLMLVPRQVIAPGLACLLHTAGARVRVI